MWAAITSLRWDVSVHRYRGSEDYSVPQKLLSRYGLLKNAMILVTIPTIDRYQPTRINRPESTDHCQPTSINYQLRSFLRAGVPSDRPLPPPLFNEEPRNESCSNEPFDFDFDLGPDLKLDPD